MNNNDEYKKAYFKPPVGWLMGRELLAGLKWIVAYSLMGEKQDPKDWMIGETITPPRANNAGGEPYWFDFIADTGDGMKAVYNIAYLCMSDLWIDSANNLGNDSVALEADEARIQHLPRGEFLFIGGDTAYHIADAASLKERFQTPFNCAALDLIRNGKIIEQRPIYGVPANHDYYDVLDGFNRQFCRPVTDDTHNPLLNDPKDPQLGLLGFKRTQTASYLALKLPFDWWLWGLDSQEGKMDKRQQAFFASLSRRGSELVKNGDIFDITKQEKVHSELYKNIPQKLIVTTPEPATVFGKLAIDKSAIDNLAMGKSTTSKLSGWKSEVVKTFLRLGLELGFLDKNGTLKQDKCRLDLSGDIHHYERYWGSDPGDANPVNYASVVAGGGGAFLHPSQTDIGEVPRKIVYPSPKDSHGLITQAILKPWNIFSGGYIWLVGGFIAFMSYFALTIPQSTWSLFDELFPENLRPSLEENKGLLSRVRQALDVPGIDQNTGLCINDYCFDLFYSAIFLVLLGFWLWKSPLSLNAAKDSPSEEWGEWRKTLFQFMLPAVAGVLLLVTLISVNRDNLPHPFMAGLLIDVFFINAMLLLCLSRIYSDVLIDRERRHRDPPWKLFPSVFYDKFSVIPETSFEAIPLWAYNLLSIAFAAFSFLRYGVYKSSIMTIDLLVALIWLLSAVGIVALAVVLGAQLQKNLGEKIRFFAIGVWHALLQATVPVCLLLYTDWLSIFAVSVTVVLITVITGKIFTCNVLINDFSLPEQRRTGHLLFGTWVTLGVCTLIAATWNDPIAVNGWRLFNAFVIGGLFSCIWFGWYLAVSLAYHGHNNEAGGGARSEQYRHMIRFKLEDTQLTGYVIGIDKPFDDFTGASSPKFRLVDVFIVGIKKNLDR